MKHTIDRREYVRLKRRAAKFLKWAKTESDIETKAHSLAMMIYLEKRKTDSVLDSQKYTKREISIHRSRLIFGFILGALFMWSILH